MNKKDMGKRNTVGALEPRGEEKNEQQNGAAETSSAHTHIPNSIIIKA